MSRISRFFYKVFASAATNNAQFGSAQLGTKLLTNNLNTIQALPAYANGWLGAVIGGSKLPPLEEMQSLQFLMSNAIAYGFQEGIAEWNIDTTYYTNSFVKLAGSNQIYSSKTNDNTGNLPTDPANWLLLADLGAVVSSSETSTTDGQLMVASGTGGRTLKKSSISGILSASSGNVSSISNATLAATIGDLLYPVGSYYINETVSTNPSTLLGFGTWTAVVDKFIVAHGSTYTSTGGSATQSIARANLPNVQIGSGIPDTDSSTSRSAFFRGWQSCSSTGSVTTDTNGGNIEALTEALGSGTPIATVPPYQAAYIWKRTA